MKHDPRFISSFVSATAFRGFFYGLPQPCLKLTLDLKLDINLETINDVFIDTLLVPMPDGHILNLDEDVKNAEHITNRWALIKPTLEYCHELLVRIQESAGWPLSKSSIISDLRVHNQYENVCTVSLCFPSMSPRILMQALPWLLIKLGDSRPPPASLAKAPTALEDLLKVLAKNVPQGINTRLLLAAAYEKGVPVRRIAGSVMQYGWSSASRWMDSTFTDLASSISAKFARDKVISHGLLSRAGFPVAEQVKVSSIETAIGHATRIGYPVVIKPSNLDGGRGVESGLMDEPALRAAYARSLHYSDSLILEKHISGRDFRLGVLNGELAWATYREPAGVWGDGASTLAVLIKKINLDPRRGKRHWSQMAPITINQEARDLLSEQDIALTDVVPKEHFVQLRRAANISSGGRPMDVLNQVHPDNAVLAVSVARLFRLDIAGIDFITSDISCSWRDVGGVICEVNGQPQFSITRPDIPGRVIAGLLNLNGRIPVIVILGSLASGVWTEKMTTMLLADSIKPGWVLSDCLFSGLGGLFRGEVNSFDKVQALLLDTSLSCLIVATDSLDWLESGMPIDRIDLIISDKKSDPRMIKMLKDSGARDFWTINQLLPGTDCVFPEWLDPLVSYISTSIADSKRLT